MSDELKPCPFCGNEPAPYWKGVGCATSGCLLNGLHLDADKWNRRAQPAEAEGVDRWSELKKLAEKATPGPWWVDSHGHRVSTEDGMQTVFIAADKMGPATRHPETGNLSHWPNDWDASYIVNASPDKILELIAALSAVTAERDRLQRNLNFTEQWYAERFERLADLGKSAGCWDAMAAIIANGTADPYEPPTYAQQLVGANHRADVAERERDQLRAEVERLRPVAREFAGFFSSDNPRHWELHALADGAAMAAEEA